MTTLHNEITINAPIEKIWAALANIEELENFDPTVKNSVATTPATTGAGASRKVTMRDGKNWFEEKVTTCEPGKNLEFQLTACSFPIHQLQHAYSFHTAGSKTTVKQVMRYQVKFGWLGIIMDRLMIRKKTNAGIRLFMTGLKAYAEKK